MCLILTKFVVYSNYTTQQFYVLFVCEWFKQIYLLIKLNYLFNFTFLFFNLTTLFLVNVNYIRYRLGTI